MRTHSKISLTKKCCLWFSESFPCTPIGLQKCFCLFLPSVILFDFPDALLVIALFFVVAFGDFWLLCSYQISCFDPSPKCKIVYCASFLFWAGRDFRLLHRALFVLWEEVEDKKLMMMCWKLPNFSPCSLKKIFSTAQLYPAIKKLSATFEI